jgi:hypothetical protein
LQSLPGGGRLYVTTHLTHQQYGLLVRALQALYTQDTQQMQPNVHAALEGPAASAASVAAAAAGCGFQPAAKRPRGEEKEQQQQQRRGSDANKLNLVVKDQMCREVHFTVKANMQLCRLFNAYADFKSLELKCCRFLYGGRQLLSGATETPQEIGMVNDDVIDCIMVQTGC